jgi:hypothetical protein
MKSLIRKAGSLVATLVLTAVLSAAGGMPERVYSRPGAGETWHIHTEDYNRQTTDTSNGTTTDTQDISLSSDSYSDDGQSRSDLQTNHADGDGSYNDHQETSWTNSKGEGGASRTTTDTDANGNWKSHTEWIWRENGKCEYIIEDKVYEKKTNLITTTTKRLPCPRFSLQVVMKGHTSIGGSELTYGPNTVWIALEDKGDDTSKGNFEGTFNATVFGECNGAGTFPVTFDVTAVEDRFEVMKIEVKLSLGGVISITCLGASGSGTMPTTKNTFNFELPAEEGATKDYSNPSSWISLTFTLRRNPQDNTIFPRVPRIINK